MEENKNTAPLGWTSRDITPPPTAADYEEARRRTAHELEVSRIKEKEATKRYLMASVLFPLLLGLGADYMAAKHKVGELIGSEALVRPVEAAEMVSEPQTDPGTADRRQNGRLTAPIEEVISPEVAAPVLRSFLWDKNRELAQQADFIVTLPRWVEVVAITRVETSWCTRGVGDSKKNCGAIKSSKHPGFKIYAERIHAIEDISILLQKPRYAGRTIDEINGTYCVDESRPGNRCENWSENIMYTVNELRSLLTSNL